MPPRVGYAARMSLFARRSSPLLLAALFAAGCDAQAAAPDAGALPVDAPFADAPGTDAAPAPTDAARLDAPAPIGGTAGCGVPASIATDAWVERSVDVGGTARPYFVHLPVGYDPARPYPVVYQLHGCSSSATRETNNVPVERESGPDAIHVRGRAAADCWDTNATGPDVAYFDAMLAAVEATYCADPERRFATGYSSGSFMTHRLACIRGALLRGVATIAGGQGGSGCTGNVAALLIHDRDDGTVNITASEGARDAHATRNGCDTSAARAATDPAPCEAYAGCDPGLPVVWCETSGMDHARQDALAAPAFWGFLSALPR